MKQRTINTSFPKDEIDLYNEIKRVSCLTHMKPAMLIRQLSREGLARRSEKSKLAIGSKLQPVGALPI